MAGPDALWFDTPAPTQHDDGCDDEHLHVAEGDRVPFVLTWVPSYGPPPQRIDAGGASESTLSYWAAWIDACTYGGQYPEAVRRSLLTIKALTYAPTGNTASAGSAPRPFRCRPWSAPATPMRRGPGATGCSGRSPVTPAICNSCIP